MICRLKQPIRHIPTLIIVLASYIMTRVFPYTSPARPISDINVLCWLAFLIGVVTLIIQWVKDICNRIEYNTMCLNEANEQISLKNFRLFCDIAPEKWKVGKKTYEVKFLLETIEYRNLPNGLVYYRYDANEETVFCLNYRDFKRMFYESNKKFVCEKNKAEAREQAERTKVKSARNQLLTTKAYMSIIKDIERHCNLAEKELAEAESIYSQVATSLSDTKTISPRPQTSTN